MSMVDKPKWALNMHNICTQIKCKLSIQYGPFYAFGLMLLTKFVSIAQLEGAVPSPNLKLHC